MEITKAVWKLILQESIDNIRNDIDKDIPLSAIQILLVMPEKGRISFREVEKNTQLPHSTCSRGLALLAGMSKLRIAPAEVQLVKFTDDMSDRRVRYAELTELGNQKVQQVFDKVASRLVRIKSATSN